MLTVILTGTTGSGKGTVAHQLARLLRGEIISLDSMKVYAHMDIGTAKPEARKRREIPYHLLDVVDPCDTFTLGRYVREALRMCGDIHGRGRTAVLVGGTPLYLRGLVRGFCPAPEGDAAVRRHLSGRAASGGVHSLYGELCRVDPESAEKIHPNDKRRIIRSLEVYYLTGKRFSQFWADSVVKLPEASYRIFGITWPREVLYRRINERVERMAAAGLFHEALEVFHSFPVLSRTARQCIGYKEIWEGLEQGAGRDEIIEKIRNDTRRFARKQLTWFRHFPEIQWVSPLHKNAFQIARSIAESLRLPELSPRSTA